MLALALAALGAGVYLAAFAGAPPAEPVVEAPAHPVASSPAPPSSGGTPAIATSATATRAGFTEVLLWRTGDDPPEGHEGAVDLARWRAVESGRYLLRSTNNGVTAVIDPFGAVTARLPRSTAGYLITDRIALVRSRTLFSYTGLLPLRICTFPAALLLVRVLLGAVLPRTKSESSDSERDQP